MRTCDLCQALEGTSMACPCHCHAIAGELRGEAARLREVVAATDRWLPQHDALAQQAEVLSDENAALKARVAGTLAELGYSQWALTEANAEARALRQQLDQARFLLTQGVALALDAGNAPKLWVSDVTAFLHGSAAISEPTTEPAPVLCDCGYLPDEHVRGVDYCQFDRRLGTTPGDRKP